MTTWLSPFPVNGHGSASRCSEHVSLGPSKSACTHATTFCTVTGPGFPPSDREAPRDGGEGWPTSDQEGHVFPSLLSLPENTRNLNSEAGPEFHVSLGLPGKRAC